MIGVNNGPVCCKAKNKPYADYVNHWLNTESFDVTSTTDWSTLERQVSPSNIVNTNSSRRSKFYDSIKSFFITSNKNKKIFNNKKTKSQGNLKYKKYLNEKKRHTGIFTKLINSVRFSNVENPYRKKRSGSLDWKLLHPDYTGASSAKNRNMWEKTVDCICRKRLLKRTKSDSVVFYKSNYLFFNKILDKDALQWEENNRGKFNDKEKPSRNNNDMAHLCRYPVTSKKEENLENTAQKTISVKTKRKTVSAAKKMNSYRNKPKRYDPKIVSSLERSKRHIKETSTAGTQTINLQQSAAHRNCNYYIFKGKNYNPNSYPQTGQDGEMKRNSIVGCSCSLNKMATKNSPRKDNAQSLVTTGTRRNKQTSKQCQTAYAISQSKPRKVLENLSSKNLQVGFNHIYVEKMLVAKQKQIRKISEDKAKQIVKFSPEKNNDTFHVSKNVTKITDKVNEPLENFFVYSGPSINTLDTGLLQSSPATTISPELEKRSNKSKSIFTCYTVVNQNDNTDRQNSYNHDNTAQLEDALLSFYTLRVDGLVERKIMNKCEEQNHNVDNCHDCCRKQRKEQTIQANNNKQQTLYHHVEPYNNNTTNYKQTYIVNFNNRIKQINQYIIDNEGYDNKN
ncbi:uncharacterized protein [Rhodnius prolixus]